MNGQYKPIQHEVCILLGSNIDPAKNIKDAIVHLQDFIQIINISTAWETLAIGSPGPNFLNAALVGGTYLSPEKLKIEVLHPIENQMGRVRSSDKNAPRIIDLDVILYDNQILEPNLWIRHFIAIPVAELYPNLLHPQNGKTLAEVATILARNNWAKPNPEIKPILKM